MELAQARWRSSLKFSLPGGEILELTALLVILFAFAQAALGLFLLGHFLMSARVNTKRPSKKRKVGSPEKTGLEESISKSATGHSSPRLGRRPVIFREEWRR